MTVLCCKCGLPLKNMRDLPDGVLAGHNKCIGIADKPEKAKTPADVEANMTIEQVRRGGVRRRG